MTTAQSVGVILLAIFFLFAGLLFLFWPDALREWSLKSYPNAGSITVLMRKLMFLPGYILAFRIAGVIAIVVSGLLIWFWLKW